MTAPRAPAPADTTSTAVKAPDKHPEFSPLAVGKCDAQVAPKGSLELLSRREIDALTAGEQPAALYELFRNCALAVLNTGSVSDDAALIFDTFDDFRIDIKRRTRGLKLSIENAPATAFVEGRMVEGIREHLFSVLRDIIYIGTEVQHGRRFDLSSSAGITDAVFNILKQARVLNPDVGPNLVVCWGGHSIARHEYEYTKTVGYHLGLRGLDICTGCGPGAMKGPMKGAAVGHAKQRRTDARYIGLTEPGIIAAEPPNPMVNQLVILPDIEKRLEAFLRLGHGIVVFPGGVGTAEEILYLLGVLLDPANVRQRLPLVFTGPASSARYWAQMDAFLRLTLGDAAADCYTIIIDDAEAVGATIGRALQQVRRQRRRDGDAYYFNWLLTVPEPHQHPFEMTHASVAELNLRREQPVHELAVALRRAFSAIVSGNVKADGIRRIEQHGPLTLRGDAVLADALDALLEAFVVDGRMKLASESYVPCYRVVQD
ncbi:MAG: nucleotide 5'-monophosphate nucleosidase PpnN [Pseudomonadota bacterium]